MCDFLEEEGEEALWDTKLVSKLFYECSEEKMRNIYASKDKMDLCELELPFRNYIRIATKYEFPKLLLDEAQVWTEHCLVGISVNKKLAHLNIAGLPVYSILEEEVSKCLNLETLVITDSYDNEFFKSALRNN